MLQVKFKANENTLLVNLSNSLTYNWSNECAVQLDGGFDNRFFHVRETLASRVSQIDFVFTATFAHLTVYIGVIILGV